MVMAHHIPYFIYYQKLFYLELTQTISKNILSHAHNSISVYIESVCYYFSRFLRSVGKAFDL